MSFLEEIVQFVMKKNDEFEFFIIYFGLDFFVFSRISHFEFLKSYFSVILKSFGKGTMNFKALSWSKKAFKCSKSI